MVISFSLPNLILNIWKIPCLRNLSQRFSSQFIATSPFLPLSLISISPFSHRLCASIYRPNQSWASSNWSTASSLEAPPFWLSTLNSRGISPPSLPSVCRSSPLPVTNSLTTAMAIPSITTSKMDSVRSFPLDYFDFSFITFFILLKNWMVIVLLIR